LADQLAGLADCERYRLQLGWKGVDANPLSAQADARVRSTIGAVLVRVRGTPGAVPFQVRSTIGAVLVRVRGTPGAVPFSGPFRVRGTPGAVLFSGPFQVRSTIGAVLFSGPFWVFVRHGRTVQRCTAGVKSHDD
jgi:hypothetical protein